LLGVRLQEDSARQVVGSGQSGVLGRKAHKNFRPGLAVRHGRDVSRSEARNLASGTRFSGRVIRDVFKRRDDRDVRIGVSVGGETSSLLHLPAKPSS
jgi:hypothetical protein